MKKLTTVNSMTVLGLVFCSFAHADVPSARSEKTTTSVLDQYSVGFFSNFHGSPIGDLGVPYTPGKKGYNTKSQGIYFDSTLTAAYKITEDLRIGPEVAFFYTPVLGRGFDTQYVGLNLFNNHIVLTDTVNVSMNIMPQLPVSDYLRNTQQVSWGLKSTPSIFYRPKHSSFAIGTYTEIKSYFGVPVGQKSFKLWALPMAVYTINDKFGVSLGYEMEAKHVDGKQDKYSFSSVGADLQPGLRWKVTKNIQFNPYLMLYTSDGVTGDNTAVGAIISASIL